MDLRRRLAIIPQDAALFEGKYTHNRIARSRLSSS
jgi:ABC-type multidrug transport system fused ATPase/permease subunit